MAACGLTLMHVGKHVRTSGAILHLIAAQANRLHGLFFKPAHTCICDRLDSRSCNGRGTGRAQGSNDIAAKVSNMELLKRCTQLSRREEQFIP